MACMTVLLASACASVPPPQPRVQHTPWLALTVEQGGQRVPLTNPALRETHAGLARAPFTLVLPNRGEDDTYRLAGWQTRDIIDLAENAPRAQLNGIQPPPYFDYATGMADTAAGSGTLMLNLEGHHHLAGLRLGPDPDRHTVFFGDVLVIHDNGARVEMPIEDVRGPINLVVWFDENDDAIMQHGEYEYLVLQFDRAS
ncbi:hypothetical protein [Aurantiacibacter gangjinensis]|nr:hypothetical protein [Aurantiacibacter gangjinensis]